MYPRRNRLDHAGADYIVPLVTKEDDIWSIDSREGILLNKGFIPGNNISKSIKKIQKKNLFLFQKN